MEQQKQERKNILTVIYNGINIPYTFSVLTRNAGSNMCSEIDKVVFEGFDEVEEIDDGWISCFLFDKSCVMDFSEMPHLKRIGRMIIRF